MQWRCTYLFSFFFLLSFFPFWPAFQEKIGRALVCYITVTNGYEMKDSGIGMGIGMNIYIHISHDMDTDVGGALRVLRVKKERGEERRGEERGGGEGGSKD